MQCAEEQRHVPESLYPFNYNPKMSLNLSQVPCSSQKSPNRAQRRETTVAKDKMVGPDVTKPPPHTQLSLFLGFVMFFFSILRLNLTHLRMLQLHAKKVMEAKRR